MFMAFSDWNDYILGKAQIPSCKSALPWIHGDNACGGGGYG